MRPSTSSRKAFKYASDIGETGGRTDALLDLAETRVREDEDDETIKL